MTLSKSQHVLNLDVFQVLLDNSLCLLLVMARSQTGVDKLLGVLAT